MAVPPDGPAPPQEVPARVAAEQLDAALHAEIEAPMFVPVASTGEAGGAWGPLVFVFGTVVLVLVGLLVALRRRRGGARRRVRSRLKATQDRHPGPRGTDAGSLAPGATSARPPERLALPPHVLEALAKRQAERRRRRAGPTDDGATASETGGGGLFGGLDVVVE